ncbi:hypothetical protein DdX_15045 [Ditylenchus destructor]|uniref:Uncharacterized protein n=1 Tax=Ditylenchus destructor TaxID=166010 RepID=A0AAD4MQ48_9BILA|nr:hypothetical protein DdX_15045 [Ditylenchus destructor]
MRCLLISLAIIMIFIAAAKASEEDSIECVFTKVNLDGAIQLSKPDEELCRLHKKAIDCLVRLNDANVWNEFYSDIDKAKELDEMCDGNGHLKEVKENSSTVVHCYLQPVCSILFLFNAIALFHFR